LAKLTYVFSIKYSKSRELARSLALNSQGDLKVKGMDSTSQLNQNRPILSPPKRDRSDPIKRLSRAASLIVRTNCCEIAQALLDHTLKGDVQSAKLLLSLCIRPAPQKRKKKKRSLATEWANEPEWTGTEDSEPKDAWGLPIPKAR
jgi:hypothetical protein